MRPNFSGIQKVLDRIDEIVQKCNPHVEKPSRTSAQAAGNRFIELLETEKKNNEGKNSNKAEKNNKTEKEASAVTAQTRAAASMDDLRRQINRAADKYNIDEELIRAVIQVESGWRRDAVSVKGAMGLMQLMPRTAAMLGVDDAFDPGQNIEGGVKYLAQLTDKYNGDVEMALAAYNAGPSRVDAAGGAPFQETARYVRNVMALYHRYREEE